MAVTFHDAAMMYVPSGCRLQTGEEMNRKENGTVVCVVWLVELLRVEMGHRRGEDDEDDRSRIELFLFW